MENEKSRDSLQNRVSYGKMEIKNKASIVALNRRSIFGLIFMTLLRDLT